MWHVFCYIRRQKILNQRDVVMRENLLKKKIQNGESAIGTFVKLTDPAALLEGKSMEELCECFIRFIISIASGSPTNNEKNGYREIAIFKSGVTL